MKRSIAHLSVLGALAAAAALAPSGALAQIRSSDLGTLQLGTSVSLQCSNPGSHQDVAKTPSIKNSSVAAIPKGKVLSWKSSDGDSGSITLQNDLAPGASVSGLGKAGQVYTCTASFNAGYPDLTVKSATWSNQTTVTASVANLNKWFDSKAVVVRAEVVRCDNSAVARTGDSTAVAVPTGATKSVTITVPAGSYAGKTFLRVTADATKLQIEAAENNNTFGSLSNCVY
jgi:hypothetical protein